LALQTLPKKTSSTWSAFTLALSKAPVMALLPKTGALKEDKAPPKLPIGVLTAETIYTLFMYCIWLG
jgi:hypothetical protein